MTTQEWCDLIADTIYQERKRSPDFAYDDALFDLAHSLADAIGPLVPFGGFNRSLFLSRCGVL